MFHSLPYIIVVADLLSDNLTRGCTSCMLAVACNVHCRAFVWWQSRFAMKVRTETMMLAIGSTAIFRLPYGTEGCCLHGFSARVPGCNSKPHQAAANSCGPVIDACSSPLKRSGFRAAEHCNILTRLGVVLQYTEADLLSIRPKIDKIIQQHAVMQTSSGTHKTPEAVQVHLSPGATLSLSERRVTGHAKTSQICEHAPLCDDVNMLFTCCLNKCRPMPCALLTPSVHFVSI